jgi:HK97 family phage major capsid protein
MDVKDYLRAEVDKALSEAENITEQAAKAARSVTPDEKNRIETLISDATAKKNRISEIEDNEKLHASIEQMRGPINEPSEEAPAGAKSAGEAFVKSDAYRSLTAGLKGGQLGSRWTTGPVEIPFDAKATVTSTASPIVQPDVQGGLLPFLMRRLTVADLLASGTTDSSSVRYLREITNTNAAAFINEGADKPESTITFDSVDEPVRKVATFLPVSDEMLEDVSQLRSYLDGRLRLFVQHAEEAALLTGSGTAPQLRGLLNRTGVQTAAKGAGANVLDLIYTAITNIRNNAFIEPDGIVMHPTNWAAIRTQKDANGQYYGGGPFTGQYGQGGISPDNVWGLPVVVTPAIAVNTALVGAFRTAAQVFRRNNLTVEASNSHADFFQKNLTAIRAEQRLALAVYRPNAFHTLTALNA